MDVNVTGTWNAVMAGAQHIIDGGRGGSIILISSAAGVKMQPFMIHYTASKHAVTGMARAFAAELGQALDPGQQRAPRGRQFRHGIRRHGRRDRSDDGDEPAAGPHDHAVPARRASAEPEDIADAVLWLASDESKFVTATAMSIDQGATQY